MDEGSKKKYIDMVMEREINRKIEQVMEEVWTTAWLEGFECCEAQIKGLAEPSNDSLRPGWRLPRPG